MAITWPRTSGTVRLDLIQDRRFTRPEWVEDSFDQLRRSIAQDGMIVPIVLNHTYEVVDGMRRLAVARWLNWTEVPAVATTNYTRVVAHISDTRRFAELHQLPHLVYAPRALYEHINMLSQLHRSSLPGSGRVSTSTKDASRFNRDLLDMFGWSFSHIVCTRTIFGLERTLENRTDPGAVIVRDFIAKWEAEWPDTLTPSSAKTRAYKLAREAQSVREYKRKTPEVEPIVFNAKATARQRVAFRDTLTLLAGGFDGLTTITEISPQLSLEELVGWQEQLTQMVRQNRTVRNILARAIAVRTNDKIEESAP